MMDENQILIMEVFVVDFLKVYYIGGVEDEYVINELLALIMSGVVD